jgi:CheY-like chemotaxis protein
LKNNIIIVEDDADDRFLMKTAFSENGFDDSLLYLENGYELLRFLDSQKGAHREGKMPGLILMDLNMPKMNGREVLQEIKKEGYWLHLPIVIFSTTQNDNEMKKCLELGALAYYTKPVTFAGLINTVALIRNTYYE